MKNCLLFLLISLSSTAFSQQTEPEVFYQTVNGEYAFKFVGNVCTLYQLSRYDNYVYREWKLTHAGEFKNQSDSIGILFSNGVYAISYDYKFFRVSKLKNGKVKGRLTFIAKKLDNPAKIYEGINHASWNAASGKMLDQISANYPLLAHIIIVRTMKCGTPFNLNKPFRKSLKFLQRNKMNC